MCVIRIISLNETRRVMATFSNAFEKSDGIYGHASVERVLQKNLLFLILTQCVKI